MKVAIIGSRGLQVNDLGKDLPEYENTVFFTQAERDRKRKGVLCEDNLSEITI